VILKLEIKRRSEILKNLNELGDSRKIGNEARKDQTLG
jgi:hypothetical protein